MNPYHTTDKEVKQLYNNLKASAKKRGILFDLKITDIDDIGIPLTCPVLGFPIYFHRGHSQYDSVSFDRINSSEGYTKDNLTIISFRANQLKSNASLDEMQRLVEYYKDTKC